MAQATEHGQPDVSPAEPRKPRAQPAPTKSAAAQPAPSETATRRRAQRPSETQVPVETDPQTAPEAQPAAEQPLLAVLAGRLTREVAAAVETFYRQALNEALEEERRRLKAVHERKPGIKRLLTRPAEPNWRHTLGQVVRQAISPLVDRLVQFCRRARAVDAPPGQPRPVRPPSPGQPVQDADRGGGRGGQWP